MANTVIAIKKSGTPSAVPTTLANGELAINYADGKIFYRAANGIIIPFVSGYPGFGTINASGTLVLAAGPQDILGIQSANSVTIKGDAIGQTITIGVDLTPANNWSNSKLANTTTTLAGSLTTTGSLTANGYVIISPSDGSQEGGEIQLLPAGNYVNWILDAYQNNHRIFTRSDSALANVTMFHANGGSVRLGVNKGDPLHAVDVSGDVNVSGVFRVNGVPLNIGVVDLTPANNWSNTKVSAVTSNSNSRVWANTVVDGNSNKITFIDLSTSGVTAATYGSATNIPIVTIDAFGRVTSASNVAVQGMDYAYANAIGAAGNSYALSTATSIGAAGNSYALTTATSIGTAGNNYTNSVGAAGNAYALSTATNIGAAGNNYTNSVGTAGNSYALTTATSVGTAGNNYTNSVGTAGNNYTNAVGAAANSYALTTATSIGIAGNNYTNAVGAAGNSYTLTTATNIGTAGNNYTNSVGVAGNSYALSTATSIGTAGNSYALTTATNIGTAGNNYTNAVGAAGNSYASSLVSTVFNVANAAYTSSNADYTTSNAAFLVANLAFNQANSIYLVQNADYAATNAAFGVANAAFAAANNVAPQIAPAFNTANAAYNTANAAYAAANTKFSSSGGTISGSVEINGSITVHGNTIFVDQQTLSIGDPLLYLAANNYSSDIVDIGWVANYVNTSLINVHTGLFRSAVTKEYYLFQGYDKEPYDNYIDPNGNNFTLSILNSAVRTSNLMLGGANAINWIASAYNTVNAVYTSSNADYVVSNAAYATINAAYAKINAAYTSSNADYVVSNSAYGAVNTLAISANSYAGFMVNSANSYASATYPTKTGGGASGTWAINATGYAGYLNASDTRAVVTTPETTASPGLWANFKQNSTEGLNDGGTYFGELTYRPYGTNTDWSGGPAHQLGMTGNGNIWYRYGSGAANTNWSGWKQVGWANTDAAIYVTANAAYATANAAYASQNADFATTNAAYNTANAAFAKANASGSVNVGANAPVSPAVGNLWWDSEYGKLFIYYTDVDGSQWVEANPSQGIDANYLASVVGPVANTANLSANLSNSTIITAIAAFNTANAAYASQNADFATTNAAYASVNSNWTVTNTVYGVSNAAFAKANAALPNTTTTYYGTLTISGNVLFTVNNSLTVPTGPTAARPGSAANGMIRYNTTLNTFEGYKAGSWGAIGGGATGGGSDDAFYENTANINSNYTITTGKNAMTAGPVTLAAGITITIPTGSTWTVV